MKSSLNYALTFFAVIAGIFLIGLLYWLFVCACDPVDKQPNNDIGLVGPEVQNESSSGTVAPKTTKGAPYPAVDLEFEPNFVPNSSHVNYPPIPKGPLRGNLQPQNPAIKIEQRDDNISQSIDFEDYEEVDDVLPRINDLGEVSVAESDEIVMMTGNTWMAFSTDAGSTFSYINPTTLFPQDDGGLCCDQVVLYVPKYELFVWLLQYRSITGADSTSDNRIRIAAQSVDRIKSSNATSWTYWDFPSNVFSATGSLDYNDMTATDNSIYWNSMIAGGRVVVRLPISQLAERTTVNYRYTAGTNAIFSHITQTPDNQVYWGGHVNTSQLRVYNWPDGDNSYYSRTININSWPNDSESSTTPSGVDWMQWEGGITTYIYGNALQGSSLWLAWQAGRGGGFPHPHVQMVRLDASTFALQEQVQVWNGDFAFQDAFLSTNSGGELGMSIGFGGGSFHGNHAVGVWGDFVVYYPTLSTRSVTRWGDYNTSRRSGSNPRKWVAGGYTLTTDGEGNNITVPHYIRFGR